jgi:hypothetical protein
VFSVGFSQGSALSFSFGFSGIGQQTGLHITKKKVD